MRNVLRRRQVAAVRLDDRSADRQADADAFRLGGVGRLEQVFGVLARETRSGVAHLDQHAVQSVQLSLPVTRQSP